MTKEIKFGESLHSGTLADVLKRMEQDTIAGQLKPLESQALSISGAVSTQLATPQWAVPDVSQLFSDRVEALSTGLRNAMELTDSRAARAASAISLTHSDSISQALRMYEESSAAHAIQISKALEQVGRTLDLTPAFEHVAKSLDFTRVFERARESLDFTRMFEQARGSLDFTKAFEQVGGALSFTKAFEQVTGTVDFTKHAEAAAKSIVEGLNIETGAAALDLRSMFDEVRASSAMSMLVAGQVGSGTALDLSAIREVVEEVVQRYVPKPGEQPAPMDFPWEARLKLMGWYALIVLMVVYVLQATFDAYWHVKVERWMNAQDSDTRTEIVTQALRDFGREYAGGLRCAKANLKVRKAPGAAAPVIGHLAVGQPVEVVESEGPYSLIRYRDSGSDVLHEGWAASGYLVKYVPPSSSKGTKKGDR